MSSGEDSAANAEFMNSREWLRDDRFEEAIAALFGTTNASADRDTASKQTSGRRTIPLARAAVEADLFIESVLCDP